MATLRKVAPRVASPQESFPSHPSIAIRAYNLFVQRGSTHGWDLDDWLQAEKELRGEHKDRPAKRKKAKPA